MPSNAISIIIGTYNQRETLKKTLLSLFDQSVAEDLYEIVVVDSESNDGTEEMIRSLNPPCDLNYIRQPNLGKAAARNRGVLAANSEIILITDADMLAHPRLIEEHLLLQSKYKNVAAEGLTYNFKNQPENFSPGKNISDKNLAPYIKERLKPLQKIRWSYFLTGNLSLKKQAFLAAGQFDENFSGYGWEDIELGYRLHKAKIPLVYLPGAINYHWHFVHDAENLDRKYNTGKSTAYFLQKHPNFEIRMFLGQNPLAMLIFNLINRHHFLKDLIIKRSQSGRMQKFFRYLLEEYTYRLGLAEGLAEKKNNA